MLEVGPSEPVFSTSFPRRSFSMSPAYACHGQLLVDIYLPKELVESRPSRMKFDFFSSFFFSSLFFYFFLEFATTV